MERASCWHLAHRKVEVGAADGTSRQERVRLVITLQLEAEENLSTMATLFWAEGVWVVTWKREQQKAWWKQIFEVQIWRQVRGLAGAVMCETRDLAHHVFRGAGGGGHEGGLPAGRETYASETSQDGLLEEMGSKARV